MDFGNITIGNLVDGVAAAHPDSDALVYVDRGLRMTYPGFRDACRTVARGLMAQGVRKGDHVGIWATNLP
ncbi:MAG: AMP-binding protein, partial [Verrucomicrobiota bacterium]